jgi:kynurenine formamidase
MTRKTRGSTYASTEILEVFGRRLRALDLGHELSDNIPVYPGHMKVATWWHLTHDESRMRMGDTDFWGYGVRGMSLCEHVSTHVDAIFHFNPTRPDLTVDTIPLSTMITPAAWVDLSFAEPRTDISLDQLRRALDEAGIVIEPGSTLLYYTGAESNWDDHPKKFLTDYPGMGEEASTWLQPRKPELPQPPGSRRTTRGSHGERRQHDPDPRTSRLLVHDASPSFRGHDRQPDSPSRAMGRAHR